MARIISLDIARMRAYLKDVSSIGDDVRDTIERHSLTEAFPSTDHVTSFPEWIEHAFAIRDLSSEPLPAKFVDYTLWALEARRTYLLCLRALFPDALPRWVRATIKLGRYAIASLAFVQFASEFPGLFNPMLVESVNAPDKVQFACLRDEMPLSSVLRRSAGGQEHSQYTSRLAQVWGVKDPEAHFGAACTLHLSVHAEMQLVNFYDVNAERRPHFRFIGVSKKSCFLCQCFLARHPSAFSVSSCHQKIYLT